MATDSLMNAFWPEFIGFIISLLCCSLFSFLETSITALRPFRLKEIEHKSKRYHALLQALMHNPHQVLVTTLIANSLANVTAAALSTTMMEQVFAAFKVSSSLGFSLGIGVGTVAILVFGEVIPKSIAKVHGDAFFESTLWIINASFYLLRPIAVVLTQMSNFFVALVGGGASEASSALGSEPEIRFLIEHGMIEKEKSAMLQSIFKLGHKPVREIMMPSTDIIMLDSLATIEEAFELFSKYQFSRVPVYQEYRDNIIGMVYQKDIFALVSANRKKEVKELVRPILFVPESMKINQLLRQFRDQRMHIAMVTNEFGSITGLVTLEDVLEVIVGEITDEYEATPLKVVPLEQGGWMVDASIDLETLAETLGIEFEVENAVTLGGFLSEQLQRVPDKGDRVHYKNYVFQVQQATRKRVVQVLILKEVV